MDTGTASLGWARMSFPGPPRLLAMGAKVLPPIKGEGLGQGLLRRLWLQGLGLPLDGVSAVVAEELVFSAKGITATAAASMCWGMLVGLCLARNLPLYTVRPLAWQRAVLPGKGKVDQGALGARLAAFVGKSPASLDLACVPHADRSHALDAVGIATYGAMRLRTLRRVSETVSL